MERFYTLFNTSIIIESLTVLQVGNKLLVRARSADGATGYVLAIDRLRYLLPILQALIMPYFTGKDTRNLEALVDGVYLV